ncbi:PREDICTED: astakine-like [Trachymyrmex septentrionalis]|nr:PREDICTED: astakine-like [Trachymyrmex septentrionalis]
MQRYKTMRSSVRAIIRRAVSASSGPRFITTGSLGPTRYTKPTCMPFQQKGEQCRVNAETITTNLTYPDTSEIAVKDIHYILCPCADGLFCNPKRGICK